MHADHIDFWEVELQPWIAALDNRADWEWKWSLIAGPHLNGGVEFEDGSRSLALTMGVDHDDLFVPCGLLLLIVGPKHLPDHRRRAVYLWYFTDAPWKVLLEKQLLPEHRIPKGVASALLDAAVVASFAESLDGRLGLHAAPTAKSDAAKAKLLEFYSSRHMKKLPLPKQPHRSLIQLDEPLNDGRYFFYEKSSAQRAHRDLSSWR